MRRIPVILILLVTFFWIPSETLAKEQLAVMDLKAKHGVEQSLADALSDIIRTEIYTYGKYEVLSKDDLEIVAKREKIQQKPGCSEEDNMCLITLGQATGTKYMIAGSLSKIGSTFSLDIKLLDTKGGSAGIKNRVNKTCKCEEDELITTARNAAASLMGEEASQISSESVEKKQRDQVNAGPTVIGRDDRFIAYDNGTVMDTSKGLMWAAKDNGYDITWSDAKRYCETYRGAGYMDWRLPTEEELGGLYNPSKSYQATPRPYNVHLTELIKLSACCPWTSRTRGSEAARFHFDTAHMYFGPQSAPGDLRALPVRSSR